MLCTLRSTSAARRFEPAREMFRDGGFGDLDVPKAVENHTAAPPGDALRGPPRAVATAAASQRHGIPSYLRPSPSAYVTRDHTSRVLVSQTRDFWKRQDRPRSGGGGGGGGGRLCSKLQIFDRDSRQTLYSLGV